MEQDGTAFPATVRASLGSGPHRNWQWTGCLSVGHNRRVRQHDDDAWRGQRETEARGTMATATKTLIQEFAEEFAGSKRLWGEARDVIPSGVAHDARMAAAPGFPLY